MNWVEKLGKYTDGVNIIGEWLGHGGHIVSPELAQQRANVCLGCSHNQKTSVVTSAVADAIRKHLALKNHLNIRVDGEKKLHACEICLCQLRLKVHVPIGIIKNSLTDEDRQKMPSWCWQITESTTQP